MFFKTPSSNKRKMVEAMLVEAILGYKDMLEAEGLDPLHVLLDRAYPNMPILGMIASGAPRR